MTYPLARQARLDLEAFARAAGAHPDLIRRLVALGLVDADRDAAGRLWFSPGQLLVVGRIQRLRAGLALNYAAVGLVLDLLDRITALETALRSASPGGRPPQTPPRASPGGRPPQTPPRASPGARPPQSPPRSTTGQQGGRTWTRTT